MSYQSDNLDLEILEEGDPADLTTVSDNFDKIDAVAGDIATIETSPTQSSHAAGEFLLYEGRLYKVTSAISAGGSLILGTNVSAANIGDEIKSLRDSVDKAIVIQDVTETNLSSNTWYCEKNINVAKSGYTPICAGLNLSSASLKIHRLRVRENDVMIGFSNPSNSGSIGNMTAYLTVVYVKNSLM